LILIVLLLGGIVVLSRETAVASLIYTLHWAGPSAPR
jgi:hypothetical protein